MTRKFGKQGKKPKGENVPIIRVVSPIKELPANSRNEFLSLKELKTGFGLGYKSNG